ncbi:nicotinamide riboside transporter PnuC [Sphingomonas sp. SUN039]|uniref:nicotinamide riboside transporter PnuC n=1 Tax=Sphingomonas sp. SUN039 TaxID=2937787 RepID=UPI0021649275|nr:nicotinamide riboside transporter PnuC [Sphingomonas sp. SUN039]UVO52950.1 nicotinamide riboside transporter PnuC [Sphingomonas sp. SUN039]
MSLLEAIAALLGLANITLIVRRSPWNYPFGIAMVVLYARIFWDARLFSDAGLQVFFLIVQLYGWIAWVRHREGDGTVAVRKLGVAQRWIWVGVSLLVVLGWGTIMTRFTTASLPYWDASVAMLSVIAQLLMTWRYLENWWWWIAVNLLSVGLYAAKGLWLTSGLYTVFLVLAVIGLLQWRRHLREAAQP